MLNLALSVILLCTKVTLALIFSYFCLVVYLHFRCVSRLNFYARQGATLYPGCKSFFLGNMHDLIAYAKAYEGDMPICGPQQWLAINHFVRKMGLEPDKKFDGSEYPVLALNFQTVTHVWVSDPEIVQDLWVGKNALLDKCPESLIMFEDIIGQSFLFAHNDEAWKTKRKACSHAFYKERLVFMLETLKDKIMDVQEKWLAEIDSNAQKMTVINMATEFSDIFSRNIITVSFGEDLSDDILTLRVKEGGVFVEKQVKVTEAIYIIIDQVCMTHYSSAQNPLNWFYLYTGHIFKLSHEAQIVKDNCLRARAWVREFIRQRRDGERTSQVQQNTDILSLMLERPDVFTDDVMTDELIGFFGAATETTQNVAKTIVTFFTKNYDSLQKVRAEFAQKLNTQHESDGSIGSKPLREQLKSAVTVENCFDLEYLNTVILEGLRFQAPGGITPVVFKEDVNLAGKLKVKAGDRIRVVNWALHKNSSEW